MNKFFKLTIVLLGGLLITLGSCRKDDDPEPTTSTTTTTTTTTTPPTTAPVVSSYDLRFTCTSSNPYLIEVDGNSDIVSGNSFKNYTLKKGTYAWKVTQQSGYALYPTVKEGTVTLDKDKGIVFP